jgi:hypothetical protein
VASGRADKEHAAKQGKTWQQVVDEFLTQAALEERNESVLDAAIRLGVAGSVIGGPDDLATNPHGGIW